MADPLDEDGPDGPVMELEPGAAVPDAPEIDLAAAAQDARISEEDLARLAVRIRQAVLDEEPIYTRPELIEICGVTPDEADDLWRALGFAIPDSADAVVYTEHDAQAIKTAFSFVRTGFVTRENLYAFARLLGRHTSRIGQSQAQFVFEMARRDPDMLNDSDFVETIDGMIPVIEWLQGHLWRRHIALSVERTFANSDAGSMTQRMVVGFVDLSGYTSFSRKVGPVELSEELEEFEYLATYLAAEFHGRVVKSLGDEVLFVTDRASDAAEIALALIERTEVDEHRLPVHVGMASGDVVPRLGDVFGPTVNLASRLTKVARPGTVLVDRQLAAELADDPAYELQRVRGLNVRNYLDAGATRLRRKTEAGRPASRDLLASEIVRRLRIWE